MSGIDIDINFKVFFSSVVCCLEFVPQQARNVAHQLANKPWTKRNTWLEFKSILDIEKKEEEEVKLTMIVQRIQVNECKLVYKQRLLSRFQDQD